MDEDETSPRHVLSWQRQPAALADGLFCSYASARASLNRVGFGTVMRCNPTRPPLGGVPCRDPVRSENPHYINAPAARKILNGRFTSRNAIHLV